MVGGEGRRVKVAMAVVALLAAACGGRSYARLAATHVDLLTALARKVVDLVASGRLTAESVPELTYPLERAQAFAASEVARRRGDSPPSLVAFQALVARYQEFVDTLDRMRRERSGEAARAGLAPALAAVETAGEAVRTALRAEGQR